MQVEQYVAADARVVRVDDALDEGARHGRVDGIATPREDASSGLRGERLGGDDHAGHVGLSIGPPSIGGPLIGCR